jgi:hypothetical protein
LHAADRVFPACRLLLAVILFILRMALKMEAVRTSETYVITLYQRLNAAEGEFFEGNYRNWM